MTFVIVMLIVLILMAVACAVAIYLQFSQKREITNLVKQLDFIRGHDTRARLTLGNSQAGELQRLVLAINVLIEQQQQQRAELAALDSEMRHALTNISHDLRTPLTSAVGYLQLLENDKLSSEQRSAYTAIAHTKLESLTVMLDQLMAFSRLLEQGSEQRELEQVNLSNLLRTSLAAWYDDLQLAGFEVEASIPEDPVLVIANSESIQRIIQNLVGNALTHGYDLLRVSLVVSQESTDTTTRDVPSHNLAVMSFANRVAKPDALQTERLFNRFYTADVSRSGKGTGLGLAIVRSLAAAYDGSATIHQDGDLLEISVSLPITNLVL